MKPPRPPPTKPPRLQNPCEDDMIGRPIRFSAATALAFIETSVAPNVPPNMYIATAAVPTPGASATSSSPKQHEIAKNVVAAFEPCFGMRWPAHIIALTAPAPNNSSSKPSVNSVICSRVSRTGICGAQLPSTKPFMKKIAATAQRPRMAVEIELEVSTAARIQSVGSAEPKSIERGVNRRGEGNVGPMAPLCSPSMREDWVGR